MLSGMSSPAKRARRGYLLAVLAALLFCGNGVASRTVLDDGLTSVQLSGLRTLITAVALGVWLAMFDRSGLRVRHKDAPRLLLFGVGGLALVNFSYFVAIKRLGVGVGLTLEYMGPVLLLVWLRVRYSRIVPVRVWAAAGLALGGCFLVVEGWKFSSLDGLGILAGLTAAIGFAVYAWGGERSGHSGYRPGTTLLWMSLSATLVWFAVDAPWNWNWEVITHGWNGMASLYVGLVGTLGGFVAAFAAVRFIPAARASVVMTLEPALAALLAWPVLGEVLSAAQVVGGIIVLGAVMWIQGQRAAGPEEQAPPFPASPEVLRNLGDQ